MTQRVLTNGAAFNDQPFTGEGFSIYASIGSAAVQYRNQRVLTGGTRRRRRGGMIKGSAGNHDIANAVQKTARVASGAGSPIAWAIPSNFASQIVSFDVRHFKDDVENESTNFRTIEVTLDASRDDATEILGTATLLDQEVRDGGIVRIRFVWNAARDGIQPTQFVATRTAGPTTPTDKTITYEGERIVEIDTPTLSDASAYTYTIRAENGAITKDVITGLSVQADASGPPAPVNGIAEEW